jgi:hypothetical protein
MKSITHSDLADMFGITRKTLYNWLKRAEIDIRKRCAICWKDQQIIYEMFGDPSVYKQQEAEKAAKKAFENNRKRQ